MADTVALVTGCTAGGIGHALVRELHARGCTVYAGSRNTASMTGLEELGAHLVALDVTDNKSCAQAVETIVAEQGRIDLLINNAGTGGTGPLLEFDIADAEHVFRTNVLGPLHLSQLVSKHMIAQRSGTIVNIGSIVGEIPTPWSGIYNASKAALHSLSRTLDMEVSGFGIHVILIAAGGVKSGFGGQQTRSFKAIENSIYASNLEDILKRATAGQATALPTAEFASRLCDDVLRKPLSKRAHYLSFGGRAFQFALLRWLPWWFVRMRLMVFGACHKIGK